MRPGPLDHDDLLGGRDDVVGDPWIGAGP